MKGEPIDEALTRALAPAKAPAPPAALEAKMLALAARTSKRIHRRRRFWAAGIAASAAAAAVVVALLLARDSSHAPQLAEDINRDGVVDVLDAFALQQSLSSQQTLNKTWDFTRDNRVDESDVAWLGAHITELEPKK